MGIATCSLNFSEQDRKTVTRPFSKVDSPFANVTHTL